ncbi:aspartate aminotransferase family protein [Arenibaculum sp.]|uniref:aspartate aminotransferase family protein n=1 Tax=Arenibaculum sp. TaxID=2865862 RepID=UPI002E1216E2|nr:aminotransferase class III-fold pyridoxal phosphate-dependent enzyme [Arenibaculum sp.]
MTGFDGRNADLEQVLAEARLRYAQRRPRSAAHDREAQASMPGGNTRTVLHHGPFPLTFLRGEGARLWDADGLEYRDFLGEYTAGLYGHSNPVIAEAVEHALRDGIVLGGRNRHEGELAALIRARFPSCELIRFCNSGTEANLMAIGAARAFTGRDAVLVFDGAYHGGVLSFAGPSPVTAPYPFVSVPYNDAAGAVEAIEREAGRLAAVLVEPMMGSAGAIPGDPVFLAALRAATARHGVALIFDEVMTSRLSPGGLQGVLGIAPDLTSFGKYLGGGLSFGAFGGRRDILERFDPRRAGALAHAGTFNNNVLSMAAGAAGLSRVYTPERAADLNARGDRLRDALNAAGRATGVPVLATGIGSILGLHVQQGPVRRPADLTTPPAVRELLHLEMIERGFYFARRGFLSLSIETTDRDCADFAAAFREVLSDWGALLGSTS